MIRGKSPLDSTLDNIRRMPLIGLVMADNSDVESRMRKAIEDENRSPTLGGLSRPYALIADLRRQYIVPALRAADDATAVAAVAARAELVRHLRRADVAACRFVLRLFEKSAIRAAVLWSGVQPEGESRDVRSGLWRSNSSTIAGSSARWRG